MGTVNKGGILNYRKIAASVWCQAKRLYRSYLTQTPIKPSTPRQLRKCQQLLKQRSQKQLVKPVISKAEKSLVSVVIGSYNQKILLEKAIQRVRCDRSHVLYEIIVVDGGSTDGSIELLIQQKDIITLVEYNRGECQGKQSIQGHRWEYSIDLGFKLAQGKSLSMISDDCLALPTAVKVEVDKLKVAESVISQAQKSSVSIVIGSYNRRSLLEKAINSVRSNHIRVPYEIIVVDGGSTDGSLEWLIQQKDIITIVQHNRGQFQGKPIKRRSWGYFMNLGFKSAQGKYILMISDDCLLLPNAVNLGLDKFEEMKKAGRKIGGVAFYFRNWPQEKEYYVQKSLGGNLAINHGMYLKKALEDVDWIEEEQYVFYKADSDVCLKMWLYGYEIVDCPGAYVEHYYDPNEAVRQTNNSVLEHDQKVYLKRWERIYYHPNWPELREKITFKYEDPDRTAEKSFKKTNIENE